ncbi:hypothetical protein SDC9_13608 [bioreactor metagenome]|uniref:NarG-like domain-containing protein n=1 Tax=bioreactor metagenome TaxID=1076179 RepID=A0A644TLQ2_9ZZZZ|nr:respiratory nitrate reductase subunit gamma [Negativicutes bacterium]
MLYFVGQIFPYIAAAVFLVGMIWRVWTWLNVPVPFGLTLSPAPRTLTGKAAAFGRELALFRSLWSGDRGLWLAAWLMHVSLFMVIGGHIVGISTLGNEFTAIGLTSEQSQRVSGIMAVASGLLLFFTLTVLLYRRTAIPEVKRLSDPADYFDLMLILAVVVSGLHMRLTSIEVDIAAVRAYMGGILSFQPVPIPNEWIFISHFFLVNLLLLYFPFSKLVHLAGSMVNQAMLIASPPVYPSSMKVDSSRVQSNVQIWRGGSQQ